jgi:hypothetical protein
MIYQRGKRNVYGFIKTKTETYTLYNCSYVATMNDNNIFFVFETPEQGLVGLSSSGNIVISGKIIMESCCSLVQYNSQYGSILNKAFNKWIK